MLYRALVLIFLLFPADGYFNSFRCTLKTSRAGQLMSSSDSDKIDKADKIGIIIIDHGSRVATANDMLLEVCHTVHIKSFPTISSIYTLHSSTAADGEISVVCVL